MSSYGTMRHGSPVAADGADRREVRRRADGGVPREPAFVRVADQADPAVSAGQLRRPLDGVVAVADVGVVVAEVLAVETSRPRTCCATKM